jgi:hypothetical protein
MDANGDMDGHGRDGLMNGYMLEIGMEAIQFAAEDAELYYIDNDVIAEIWISVSHAHAFNIGTRKKSLKLYLLLEPGDTASLLKWEGDENKWILETVVGAE